MQKIKTQYELSDFLMKNLTGQHVTTMEKILICSIASFTNPENGWKCWPSLDVLMLMCCATRPTVVKAASGLRAKGLLTWQKGRSNVSNKYWIDIGKVGELTGKSVCYGQYYKKENKENCDEFEEEPF